MELVRHNVNHSYLDSSRPEVDTPENSNDICHSVTFGSTELVPVQDQVNETEQDELLRSILAV
jgi:hypothetical protein